MQVITVMGPTLKWRAAIYWMGITVMSAIIALATQVCTCSYRFSCYNRACIRFSVTVNFPHIPVSSILLDEVVIAFLEKYVATGCTSSSRIVHSVDSVMGKDLPLTSDTTVTLPQSESIASSELMKEIHCLRDENDVLKAQSSVVLVIACSLSFNDKFSFFSS